MTSFSPGSKLGRFEISGVLGQGAMGTVLLAHDPQIDRPVAIKTLKVSGAGDELAREIETRFLKEARLAGRLQHANIVTIYEAGEDRGVFYIAMEYVEGESLNRFVANHPDFPLPQRLDLVRQVALALDHAHQRGVIHRDIKPGNILVTADGHVKVADFGIGKLLTDAGNLTRTGQMIGSPAYMSPEQIRGEKLDGRSDFFSLGVVLYELTTGSRPFPGDSITTLVYQILHTEPRDPLELRTDLPPAAREVFARLLAKSPEKRPASAPEFVKELERIARAERYSDRTIPYLRAAPRPEQSLPISPPAPAEPREKPPEPASLRRGAFPTGPLFAVAAILLAAAALIAVWRRAPRGSPAGSAGTAAAPQATARVPSPAAPTAAFAREEPAPPTPPGLPTSGPARAADAIVGAPRYSGAIPRASRPAVSVAGAVEGPGAPSVRVAEASGAPAAGGSADRVYRTRRFAKFGVSPDQARIWVDGRYVGIADDWDDHGGGRTLELGREGAHRVRLELPGYKTLNLEVVKTADAGDETVDINDDLKREAKLAYPKLPKLDERTVGPVEFRVDPPDAVITEDGRALGAASSFGPDSPLRLSGPMVHDLVISAPGRKPKTIRVLVASNADSDRAVVKVSLKKE